MGLSFLHIKIIVMVCAVLLCVDGGVHAEPLQPKPESSQNDHLVTSLEELVSKSSPLEAVEGVASYYAKRFEGRKTSSGQRYHPEKMTAAHYTLPLGTVVRVVNPATNQEVQVTVNDRCAPKKFHFIDLSRAAAKKIGLWGKGKIKVVIIPLAEEPGDAEAPA
jgi:rare lipoprotein A